MIVRHGFGRHSVDGRHRVAVLAAPSGDRGGGVDRLRRGGPSRSTLPPSLVDTRSAAAAQRPVAAVRFTDVDAIVVGDPAVTSRPTIGAVEVEGGRDAAQSSPCRQTPAAGGRSTSSAIGRIAPPRSSKSTSTSRSSAAADKQASSPSAAAAGALGGVKQAKTGERLSNYSRGPMPPRP